MKEYILAVPNHKDGEDDPAYVQGTVVGELTRCKDCKHYKDGKCWNVMRRVGLDDDWFCADGERK